MKRLIAVVGFWCVSVAAYAAGGDLLSGEALTERIQTILTTLRYDLTGQSKFCQAFFKAFQAQKAIVHIQPLVQTDDYQAPELQQYLSRCPNLDLNKVLTLEARYADDIRALPPDEQDQYGKVYRGTRNFRLYRVDINNNPADGEEFLFYHEQFLLVSRFGQPLDPREGEEYDNRGAYRAVDLQRCKVLGGVATDRSRATATVPNYHGVISFKKHFYIYDVYPFRGADTYSVSVNGYDQRRGRVIPLCGLHSVLPKQERAK